MFPTDFSEFADKALEYIKELKEAGTEEVVILHIIEQFYIDAYEEAFLCPLMHIEMETKKLDGKTRRWMKNS